MLILTHTHTWTPSPPCTPDDLSHSFFVVSPSWLLHRKSPRKPSFLLNEFWFFSFSFFSEKIPCLGWMRNPTNTDSGCTFVSCLLTRPLGDIRPVEPLRPETASSRRRCQSNEAPPSLTPRAGWAVTRVFEWWLPPGVQFVWSIWNWDGATESINFPLKWVTGADGGVGKE